MARATSSTKPGSGAQLSAFAPLSRGPAHTSKCLATSEPPSSAGVQVQISAVSEMSNQTGGPSGSRNDTALVTLVGALRRPSTRVASRSAPRSFRLVATPFHLAKNVPADR